MDFKTKISKIYFFSFVYQKENKHYILKENAHWIEINVNCEYSENVKKNKYIFYNGILFIYT